MDKEEFNTRVRIESETDRSFFIEAGAGAGKTAALINRLTYLIQIGTAKPKDIVAITFTEAAAVELKSRLFETMQVRLKDFDFETEEYKNLKYAIDHIEDFILSTIHGFAHKILTKYSTEAGIPFSFNILSNDYEIFQEYQKIELEIKNTHYELIKALNDAYPNRGSFDRGNLTGLIDVLRKIDLQPVDTESLYDNIPVFEDEIQTIIQKLYDSLRYCTDNQDKLYLYILNLFEDLENAHLFNVENTVTVSQNGDTDEKPLNMGEISDQYQNSGKYRYSKLGLLKFNSRKIGVRANWKGAGEEQGDYVEEVRETINNLKITLSGYFSNLLKLYLYVAINELVKLNKTLFKKGYLSFEDLLKHSVKLLENNESIRQEIASQYKYISVDEYQDTDYRQYQLLNLITQGAQEIDKDLKIFFVGDPKQSIYAFRNANLDLYFETKKAFDIPNDNDRKMEISYLLSNFRSQPEIINWVNQTFKPLFDKDPKFNTIQDLELQKEHTAIVEFGDLQDQKVFYITYKDSVKETNGDILDDLNQESNEQNFNLDDLAENEMSATKKSTKPVKSGLKVQELMEYSSEKIARTIRFLVDKKIKFNEESDPISFNDIAIIVPTRTAIDQIVFALEKYDIPCKFELKSDIMKADTVKSLVSLLKVILDPTDLNSWVYLLADIPNSLGQEELCSFISKFKLSTGNEADVTLSNNKLINLVLKYNKAVSQQPFDEIFDEILQEFYVKVTAVLYPKYRDAISKLNNFIYAAYDFIKAGNLTLTKLIDWLEYLRQWSADFSDISIFEEDYDAVRIVTIHAAKGLEYNVVFLTGLKNLEPNAANNILVACDFESNPKIADVHINNECNTKDLKIKVTDFEAIRRLYVACTRAKELMFIDLVSLDRPFNFENESIVADEAGIDSDTDNCMDKENCIDKVVDKGIVECFFEIISKFAYKELDVDNLICDFEPITNDKTNLVVSDENDIKKVIDQVNERVLQVSRQLKTHHIVTPSSLNRRVTTAQIAQAIEDDRLSYATNLPSSSKGPMGARIGTTVHKALELIDFKKSVELPEGKFKVYVDDIVSEAVSEFEVSDQKSRVAKLINHALNSACIKQASQRNHYKEVYIGVPVCSPNKKNFILEGFIDLLIEFEDSLTIVDYKTTALSDEAELENLKKDYEAQGIAYAYGINVLMNKPVSEVIFLMLADQGGYEMKLTSKVLDKEIPNLISSLN